MMNHTNITIDCSLFYIEQHHVDTFQSIALKMKDYSYIVKEAAVNKEDAWIVAFNVWLVLLPDAKNHILIQSVDKTIYYSANYIIYNALKQDLHFQNFKQRKDANSESIYLASLFLASGLNDWFLFVLKKYNIVYMAENNNEKGYFNVLDRTEEEIQEFLQDQALFIKAVIQELKTDSFSKMIKKSCESAYQFYFENFVKSTSIH